MRSISNFFEWLFNFLLTCVIYVTHGLGVWYGRFNSSGFIHPRVLNASGNNVLAGINDGPEDIRKAA